MCFTDCRLAADRLVTGCVASLAGCGILLYTYVAAGLHAGGRIPPLRAGAVRMAWWLDLLLRFVVCSRTRSRLRVGLTRML